MILIKKWLLLLIVVDITDTDDETLLKHPRNERTVMSGHDPISISSDSMLTDNMTVQC